MKCLTCISFFVFLILASGVVQAAPMAYEFAGVIDWVFDSDSLLDGSVQRGTEFLGRFAFDSTAADSDPSLVQGVYSGPSFSSSVICGSYSWFSGLGNGSIIVANGSSVDMLTLATEAFPVDSNIEVRMGGNLYDNSGRGFTCDALPIYPFSFSTFEERYFYVKGDRLPAGSALLEFGGRFTAFTVVPEPTAVCLIAMATAFMRRRSIMRPW